MLLEFMVLVSFGFLIYLVIIIFGKLFLGDIIFCVFGMYRFILKIFYSVRDVLLFIFLWCKGVMMYVFFFIFIYL